MAFLEPELQREFKENSKKIQREFKETKGKTQQKRTENQQNRVLKIEEVYKRITRAKQQEKKE